MGTRYYPAILYGIFFQDSSDIHKWLASQGYVVDAEELEEQGWEVINDTPGLEDVHVQSPDAGGYTAYLGFQCLTEAEGKHKFETAFPNIKHAELHQFSQAL